jgi:sigma-B regulation protein RsbU (phosphoserine phosphatase)
MTDTTASARVLVADDQSDVLEALRFLLLGTGLEGEFVTSPSAVLERLATRSYEALLIDLNYATDTTSGQEGLSLLTRVRQADPMLPVVVMTGWATIDTAVEAMRRGARSLVQKPWDNATLLDILQREIADGRAARQRDERRLRDDEDARLIQRSLLPKTPPQVGPYDIAAAWQPASGYGGDCYDIIPFAGALGLSIADVAGKGLPAALLMSNLQAAVRAFVHDDTPPSAVCANVNRLLCSHMLSGRFVTCCYARLDCRTLQVSYANAGHNPPILLRASGEVVRLSTGGIVLGVFPDTMYQEQSVTLAPGDRLVFYTDGISEAWANDSEEYGDDRLIATARAHADAPSAELNARLFDDVLAFAGGTLRDDATLITVVVAR